jgi:hypothetical protein
MNLDSITKEIRKEIDKLNHVLQVLNGIGRKPGAGRRKISAVGLARIAAAQRKRWRAVRAGKKK